MVKVRKDHPKTQDGSIDFDSWLDHTCLSVGSNARPLLTSACQLLSESGYEPGRSHGLSSPLRMGMEMVDILTALHLDPQSLVAALLYRLVREGRMELELVREHFGAEIQGLVKGVLGMAAINAVQTDNDAPVLGGHDGEQLEKIRKMLVSIIDDVRVALIKIAERTCVIRLAKSEPEAQRRKVAKEIFSIYAPLAHRLGIGYIKWELEDLAFSYLNPEAYKRIAKLLDERRMDRERQLELSIATLNNQLKNTGIKAEIHGRVKHIYSIWRKMQRKSLEFHELYDIRAIRVLVDEIQECYAALGIVHSIWHHIPREFDDYIATPKENGYQSLHTAVLGPDGKTLEVQIRTHQMHEEAELGVCSHWAYKGTDVGNSSDSYEKKLNWLRQVLEWHEEIGIDVDSFADQWRRDVESDRVYVFTRDGHVIDLPAGATPVDFAYRVHTEIGNTCRGAKVGGRIVPLTYTLKTGDQIDILTARNAMPSRDWLNPEMGYVATSRARAKVINWFRKQDRDTNLAAGKHMLDTELRRLALRKINYETLAHAVNQASAEDMFVACGAGDLRLRHVVRMAQEQLERSKKEETLSSLVRKPAGKRGQGDVTIEGVGNLLTHMAGCCHPVPGDPISGYISINRGVTIHREDCPNMLYLSEQEPERTLAVNWSEEYTPGVYPVCIRVKAFDRPGLIRDISYMLSNEKVNMLDMSSHVSARENSALITCKIEVTDIDRLAQLLAKIQHIPNVMTVSRDEDSVVV